MKALKFDDNIPTFFVSFYKVIFTLDLFQHNLDNGCNTIRENLCCCW